MRTKTDSLIVEFRLLPLIICSTDQLADYFVTSPTRFAPEVKFFNSDL